MELRRLEQETWPYMVRHHRPNEADDIEKWLIRNVGGFPDLWTCTHYFRHTDYYFRNDNDATAFLLKWG